MKSPDSNDFFVYVLQNENHLANAINDSHSSEKKIFILLDEFSGLNLAGQLSEGIAALVLCLSNPFPASPQYGSRIKKFLFQVGSLWRIKFQVRLFLLDKKISKLIFFNDSALTKVIVQELKSKEKELRAELWIDTLVSFRKKNFWQFFLVFVEPFVLRAGLIGIVPSIFGTTTLADRVLVPHKASRNVLEARGQAREKLFVEQTPRQRHMREVADNWVPRAAQRVLVVASAWEWHGRADVDRWQDEFLTEIVALTLCKPNLPIRIRSHPRQSTRSRLLVGSTVQSGINDFETDLLESSHVVSLRSSALFDAYLLGKHCYVYEKNAPRVTSNEFIDSLPRLASVNDILALVDS